ncbi:hypothetical protein [Trinickia fusca]|uniref:Uncharacterized protein n=1 Tax=Trinickia fusca TaxID=2419777 RepID=A0A494XLU5_9BURK|nr:hypothetical protein [Trinickia fusca]RKP50732.1 hypothetical protein D7S89_06520 [Trinickia fusca]
MKYQRGRYRHVRLSTESRHAWQHTALKYKRHKGKRALESSGKAAEKGLIDFHQRGFKVGSRVPLMQQRVKKRFGAGKK